MRERRVQAVLLRQELGEILVVVLHFVEFTGEEEGGAVSFGIKIKRGGGGGGPNNISGGKKKSSPVM